MSGPGRDAHGRAVAAFLAQRFSGEAWVLTPPPAGRGHESYLARRGGDTLFVKLGARAPLYEALAVMGLAPAVLADECLPDGTRIMVQHYVAGRKPRWSDFQSRAAEFAAAVKAVHHSPALRGLLPAPAGERLREAGLAAVDRVRLRWAAYQELVPAVASRVDATLALLAEEAAEFTGSSLVASHNDICNANWLIGPGDELFLLDLEAMTLDDPAHDLGALLWWYYPPGMRSDFIRRAGYADSAGLRRRMRVRMALHCLNILLPRPGSYDSFAPERFARQLKDFWAVVAGEENPQGYEG